MDLRTDFTNDIINTSVNEKRKYREIENADGTKSFEDVTVYTQEGSAFGANEINATNEAVNELNKNLTELGDCTLIYHTIAPVNATITVEDLRKYRYLLVAIRQINGPEVAYRETTLYPMALQEIDAKPALLFAGWESQNVFMQITINSNTSITVMKQGDTWTDGIVVGIK